MVNATLGAYPDQTLADAGYRSKAVFEALAGHTEAIVPIGREGKSHRPINAATLPLTAAMAEKRSNTLSACLAALAAASTSLVYAHNCLSGHPTKVFCRPD